MKHRIQMRAAASALAACICLSVLPGALAAEPGRVKAPGRTEMEHGPVSTEFASTRLAFAVSDPVRNNDGTITLDVAYADSEGVRRERVTPTGMTENDGKTVAKPTAAAWLTATESFAIIPDRLYYVGDNEVAIYLTQADDGTLILLDAGWPASGYQYWRNIEAMGFDPRDIDYILLTHGHGDQYGTGAELDTMIKNAGGDPVVYECYEDTYGYDIYGFPEITGIIKDTPVLNAVDKFYINDTWMEFDGSVRIKPVLTAGHTNGTDSFIFELTDPATNETLTISYLGGYGVNGNTKYDPDNDPTGRGYLRLAFQYGLRYLQQTVEPDYMLPQHTNQYPMLEINKAAEEKGIPFLEAVNSGSYEWVNFLEKRQAVITYEDYYQNWKADPKDEFGTEITVTDAELQTIEAAGPYRREGGTYQITLTDGGRIIQGFNRYMNQTDKLSGVENAQGQDVGDGIFILKDSFTHDPDAWYVQVGARVSDGYDGSCAGGPIESVHDNWFEILRTERLDSREEAEALLAQLQSGATYTVTLDQSSEIQLADNLTDTFQPAAGGTFTDVPATHWAAGAVEFVTSQGLLQGTGASTFAPGQPMTRAMLVTALWREAGSPVVNYAMDFDDVDEDQWYTEAVRWAVSKGIVAGTGKGFSPDAALTRESLAAILFRYAGGQVSADDLSGYADGASVSAWAREAMNWAVAQGLITGKSGGRLDPGGTASRAEVSAILMRYVQSAQA